MKIMSGSQPTGKQPMKKPGKSGVSARSTMGTGMVTPKIEGAMGHKQKTGNGGA